MDNFKSYYSGENNNNEPIQDVNFVIVEDTSPTEHSGTSHGSKHKHRFNFRLSKMGIALLVVLCLLTSTVFGFGGAMLANHLSDGSDSFGKRSATTSKLNIANTGTTLELATESDLTIKEIAALNANSVVEIKTEAMVTDSWMQQYVTEGAGSGVVISSDGYIVTNNHVIENSNKITVTLKNNKSYKATLVGRDDESDLAVLKIDASGLTPVVYGDSSALEVGDLSVVIGNPLGSLGGTVTAGIVSALDRSITIDGKSMTLLQTDASINPGNSGGGMFNQNGELVGIIVAKSSGSDVEGLGFAIPVNQVKKIAQQLADYGYVKGRVDTGITFVDLTDMKNAIFYSVRSLGIYVKTVDSELAKNAGFQSGDMIYYVGDKKIESASDLTSAFNGYKVGDKVIVTVIRNDDMKKLTLTLCEKTSS
ncbi:S1C family serine protease [Aminipila sp.]|uniref:S1C family serine protease n=1 Tax=Aminipila sp. TaxID=2060095 RepID=UPI00289F3A8D|nr:trypsin-like peptidase domain-containing protein [Aminipila sp.]